MTRELAFTVYGQAKPQGSKRHVGHGVMVESSKGLGAWRSDVARAAAEDALPKLDGKLLEGPLCLHAVFYRLRPKSLPKRVQYPATRPDSSKLLRAIEDAMEGILYANDAQFVSTHVEKRFGEPARVEITLGQRVVS